MLRRFMAAIGVMLALVATAQAQQRDTVFIQVEAQSSIQGARASARSFGEVFDNVAAFSLGGGWYGVAIGPYTADEGRATLRNLRSRRQVPRDSYLQDAERYGTQVWPEGADRAATIGSVARDDPAADAPANAEAQTGDRPETPAEARASERRLTRTEREELQIALRWADHYGGRIDAAFGPGTRGAMRDWQRANGYEVTGVLTTGQRAELLRQYNSVFDGLGFAEYRDDRAGIAMELPRDAIRFARYEPPFALFESASELGARVLLISQPGDRRAMNGLYEIMQTLEIVPLEGERSRDSDGFVLTGRDADIVSHTEVGLADGAIKGFTLIWPAGDEARRTRVLGRMQDSFTRIPGVLDPAALPDDEPQVDLVAGLRVRQPVRTASGFFVDRAGRVLTSTAAVEGCTRITLNSEHEAGIVARDDALGLAVLRPEEALAPRRVAQFSVGSPRLRSEVAVAGYTFGGVLGAPTLTFGTLAETRGLRGEEALKRLALASQPGDAGGPVLDSGGTVLGMLLPRDDTDNRRLPQDVSFAAKTDEILDFLGSAGIDALARDSSAALDPEDLTRVGTEMTVLVSCWD